MGVDITYECIDNCNIRVHLKAYRDCSGSAVISNAIDFINLTAGCDEDPVATSGWSAQVTTEVTPICPGAATQCTDGSASINGVEEFYWFRNYEICSDPDICGQYIIEWSNCCRNATITSGAASEQMYSNATILNTSLATCNNSPVFSNPPVPYICAGQSWTFNQGASDPDGDSLAYRLGPCFDGPNPADSVTYSGGYSSVAPLGPSWDVNLNSVTGDITFSPIPGNIEVGVMCVYVDEFRGGALIGTVSRDIQITVINCGTNTVPDIAGPTSVTGGSAVGFTILGGCTGSHLSFDIPVTDPDAGQVQTMWWSDNLVGATFTDCSDPTVTDTIIGNSPCGHFDWTPTVPGYYSFLITVQDDNCPIFGSTQYTFEVLVSDLSIGGVDSYGGCLTGDFCADVTGVNFPFTYSWTGKRWPHLHRLVCNSCLFWAGNLFVDPSSNGYHALYPLRCRDHCI